VPRQMMGTVDKALSLMRHFSLQSPEFGLSDLARAANMDKATTLRCLTALERNGFVEQDITSRKYKVGVSPLHLAQIRERSFPVESVIAESLEGLAFALGETAHGTLLAGPDPVTVAVSSPDRALFVHVHPSSAMPWHATASGIAIGAHMPPEAQDALLQRVDFAAFTQDTPARAAQLQQAWDRCRQSGIARAVSTFEDDVTGTAVPIFGQAGFAIGAIAVASVSMRTDAALQQQIDAQLQPLARRITTEIGGTLPQRR